MSLATLPQTPLHVLGLVLRHLDTLHSLGAAMSPATARLAYAAHVARRGIPRDRDALRRLADDWLVPLDADDISAHAGSEGGPLGVWPWGLSLADVVAMSRAHGVVEALTKRLVDGALPACAELLGREGPARATEAEITRIHRLLYGYEIYCGLLFRDAGDCAATEQPGDDTAAAAAAAEAAAWRAEVNAQLSASLYRDNVARAHSQLACIHDFLEDIVLQAFKQVAMYDVTWGAHHVDYLSTGSANEHVQAYLSLGLDYIYKLSVANTALPRSASPDARLRHFRRLRGMLLTHRSPPLPAAAAANANIDAATAAVERRHARHLWDEPVGPPYPPQVAARREVLDRWIAEEAAHQNEVEETERPAMKRSWARREAMHAQGYRGFYMGNP
ncbi:hypothetical protein ISF_01711 [Cordyceps fumosorosea ARSEF 2679]|uniref:Uncharacterized protein n=1 Tax=Cordyceps fumosorosea (strain ARSEF 2679) TaxID=1081104 RepID=A0A168CAQ3_CORFA|nr:hypothetical protein ISF_01711 [Cordyceps fumosorosea ARSEF 2679]OAA71160.1 hypothetical protein ISF_01711 [Cordyceps fumosorosea ARSEF 2679]